MDLSIGQLETMYIGQVLSDENVRVTSAKTRKGILRLHILKVI